MLPLIPLLLGGAGFIGAGKLAGAYVDNDDARKINEDAQGLVRFGEWIMEDAQKYTSHALTALGRKKAQILNTCIKDFVDLFSQIHNIDFNAPATTSELGKFHLDQPSLDSLRELSKVSMSLTDASGVALTAFAAYGAASVLGVPSAGAAITALTGLATNSTLSFITGGSLAAGVSSVLGGLVTAPALVVLGFFLEGSAARNLEDAKSNKSQALRFVKEMQVGVSACNGIRKMAYLYERLLMRTYPLMTAANNRLRQIISSSGTDYKSYSQAEKDSVGSSASLAVMVKRAIDTPILNNDGSLIEKSLTVANEIRQALPA